MIKFKRFFQAFVFLLPFQRKPKIHRWLILFNGDFVGVYWGENLEHFYIECWIRCFPGDPEPIMLVEFFEFY